jgi:hypothetical protein
LCFARERQSSSQYISGRTINPCATIDAATVGGVSDMS